jgi:cytochrome P450
MAAPILEDPAFVEDMVKIGTYEDGAAALKSTDLIIFRDEYVGDFLARTLTALNGEEHINRRRIEAALVSSPALLRYEAQTLKPLLDEYLDECRRRSDADGHFRCDLVDAGLYLLVRIGALIGGLDGVDDEESARRLGQYVEAWGVGTGFEWLRLPPSEMAETKARLLGVGAEYRAEFFDGSLQRRNSLIAAHQAGDLEAKDLPQDLLTILLLHREDSWDDDLLFREVALYLNASIKTTTRALCHSVHELSRWFAAHPDDEAEILSGADHLRGAIGEVLRLHPLTPAMVRRAMVDVTLPSGRTIAAGSDVGILFARGNRDQSVFGSDADEFDPFRYKRLPAQVPSYGLAFGGGRHVCMGRRMATGGPVSPGADLVADGTVNALVQRFFTAGVELDPDRLPVSNTESYYDEYVEYPVRLTKL